MFLQKNKKRQLFNVLALLVLVTIAASLIVQSVSAAIVDTGWANSSKMTTWIQLHKDVDEIDNDWDYYSVQVTLEDTYYINNANVNPFEASVRIAYRAEINGQEQQVTRYNYAPTAGIYSGDQGTVRISISFLTIDVFRPSKQITIDESYDGTWHYFDWDVTGLLYGWLIGGFCFDVNNPFAQFAITIIVPQGAEVYTQAWGHIEWWASAGGYWSYVADDTASWACADNQ